MEINAPKAMTTLTPEKKAFLDGVKSLFDYRSWSEMITMIITGLKINKDIYREIHKKQINRNLRR